MTAAPRTQPLDADECRYLLTEATVGRVGFLDGGEPAVLPVTYTVDDAGVAFRTAQGSRLARAADGGALAFEVDALDPVARTGWSVVVRGTAHLEQDPQVRARLDEMLQAWVPGPKAAFVRLPLTSVTGRRVGPLPE